MIDLQRVDNAFTEYTSRVRINHYSMLSCVAHIGVFGFDIHRKYVELTV